MTIAMPPEEAEAELAKLYTERMGKPVTVHIAVPLWTNTATPKLSHHKTPKRTGIAPNRKEEI